MMINRLLLIVYLLLLSSIIVHCSKQSQPPNVKLVVSEPHFSMKQFLIDIYTSDRYLMVLTTVVTNSFIWPPTIISFRSGLYAESVTGAMLFITSTMYHIGEILNVNIWGMSYGKWHRLDNIFVIVSLQNIFFYLFTSTSVAHIRLRQNQQYYTVEDERFTSREKGRLEFARWIALAHTILCQEKLPWVEFYTMIPILFVLIYTVCRYLLLPIHYRPRYSRKNLIIGGVIFSVGIFFFVLGLDNKNDYLRIKHGLWHLFGGISLIFLFRVCSSSIQRYLMGSLTVI
jgi:hypothetical protein